MGLTGTSEPGVRCRVAVIGAGAMAREHIKALRDIPGVVISGIHSRTRERAQALADEFGIATVADSVLELYERTTSALAVIAVPELETSGVAGEAFAHPWTSLIEKPAGYDLRDAEAIAAAGRAAGRRSYVALNRRAYSSTRTALAALAEDTGPRFIRILDQEDQKAASANGQPDLVVANWMYANAIHMIDLLRVFGRGQVRSVRPVIHWDPNRPAVVVAQVEFEDGDSGLYEGIWHGPGPWAAQITTPDQMWELRPIERAGVQRAGERSLSPVTPDPVDTAFKPGFRRQAEAAVRAAMGEPSELPTLEDGLETMRLVQAIFETE